MSKTTAVEEVAGELAKWLTSNGVSFAVSMGKAGLEALEFVGHGLRIFIQFVSLKET
jgi:hypothetical protein